MDTKRCTKCGLLKPLSEFSKCKRTKDGLQFHCTDCKKEYYTKQREAYEILYGKPKITTKKKRVYCYVDPYLHRRLKVEAEKYSMSVSQLLNGAIDFYIENYKD